MIKTELLGQLDCLEGIHHAFYLWPDGVRDIAIFDKEKLHNALISLEISGVTPSRIDNDPEFYKIIF